MRNRVLVVSDLHAPFIHERALLHCKRVYRKHNCNKVVFIGDLLDNAATSNFASNPDGFSPTSELGIAIDQLKPWYRAFPDAIVTAGNHDFRVAKKMQHGNISSMWIKSFNDVLRVPKWVFVDGVTIDKIKYLHGEACSSTIQSLLRSDTSIVFGHYHSKFEIIYTPNKFAMCVGWLGDDTTYAFDYGKFHVRRSILGCAVVLDGKPILEPLIIK